MTTSKSSKPRRTMLPPNLARNYYEVKRLIAEGDGRALPHWYQLTAEQQKAEDLEVELFRRAILRSEEEQDLVASFNAPPAEEPQPTAAAAESTPPAVENCGCPGCSTVRALDELIRQAMRLEVTLAWDVDRRGQGAVAYAFKAAPPTAQEYAGLKKRTKDAVNRWAAGESLTFTGLIPAPSVPVSGLSWHGLERWIMRAQDSAPRSFLRPL